jgi:hypothetical protein
VEDCQKGNFQDEEVEGIMDGNGNGICTYGV